MRGHAVATMTVRGERLLQSNKPASDEESDEDDTVVLGETLCTDGEGTLSDSDTLGVNESDSSHTELVSPPAKGAVPGVDGVLHVLHSVEL